MTGLAHPAVVRSLRALTPARVALGRTGVSQQTRDVLDFQQAHATARDAVHASLDAAALAAVLARIPGALAAGPVLRLHSSAPDRATYLQRPDLGRKLNATSLKSLAALPVAPCDLALVVADGLSALAVERHAVPLLEHLLPRLGEFRLAPISVVEQGRVAISDQIGEALHAQMAAIIIGERPGLSAPDSLGIYITWMPRPGRTDADRVCISNVRTEGLPCAQAAENIEAALSLARRRRFTGIPAAESPHSLAEGNPA
ncbi:MAG TPA: ethanolamine ammonia-lyase subunit EutC [Terracidiphilus sp.]|nr:ethanolamine ammonia-lyase subunit EutC [Terracidiphilus sp.]